MEHAVELVAAPPGGGTAYRMRGKPNHAGHSEQPDALWTA
jgi:hypothetical protein